MESAQVKLDVDDGDSVGKPVVELKHPSFKQDEARKKRFKIRHNRFRTSIVLASRTALGACIAGLLLLREGNNRSDLVFLPEYYFLGGLSYAAVMVVFSAGRTLGEVLMETWRGMIGVVLALVYNVILFQALSTTQESLIEITVTLDGESYYVSQRDVLVFLPFLFLFTLVAMLVPIHTSTKKFAVGLNAYFILTMINPNDKVTGLKDLSAEINMAPNFLRNFCVYFLIGIFGSIIAILVMLFPSPVLAVKQVKGRLRYLQSELDDMLNIALDLYCVQDKSSGQARFANIKLSRMLKESRQNYFEMKELISHVWWEQLFGFDKYSNFHKGIGNQYVDLYRRLIDSLKAMKCTMKMEEANPLEHAKHIKDLRDHIYRFQRIACKALTEISKEIHKPKTKKLSCPSIAKLNREMERLLQRHRQSQLQMFRKLTTSETAFNPDATLALNLFLFNLISFGENVADFPNRFNNKRFDTFYRVRNAFRRLIKSFFTYTYTRSYVLAGIKLTLSVTIATFPAIYVYGKFSLISCNVEILNLALGFNATGPSTIAVIMGNHLGGSFQRTSNRVIGVVIGSIVPTILEFFICALSSTTTMGTIFRSIALFTWTVLSMNIFFSIPFFAYSGQVAAYIAAQVFLDDCPTKETSLAAYSDLLQVSMGILIFTIVELVVFP